MEKIRLFHLNFGNEIKFAGISHGSVGYFYELDFPQDAFSAKRTFNYYEPDKVKMGMCGADKASVKFVLKPLRSGVFCIKERTLFRGSLKKEHVHYYLVLK